MNPIFFCPDFDHASHNLPGTAGKRFLDGLLCWEDNIQP